MTDATPPAATPQADGAAGRRSLLPVAVGGLAAVLAGMVVLEVWDPPLLWQWPALQFAVQIVVMTGGALLLALVVARGYLRGGALGMVLLGAGALAFAGAGLMPVFAERGDLNERVTLHNLAVFISAVLHFAGVAASARAPGGRRSRLLGLLLAYGGTVAALAVVWLVADRSATPVFFVQGQGGTPLRQAVLGGAALLDGASAALLAWGGPAPQASEFRQWYALGLALLCCAMGALLLQPAVGSPMGWLGILAQFTASACLVVAGIHWGREAPPAPRQDLVPRGVDRRLSYGLAAVFVFAAAVLRLVLIPGLGKVAPFSHFFPAVLLAGLYGGWGPGCLAIVLSLLCGQYLWVPPEMSLMPSTLEDTVAAVMFAITSGLLLTLLLLIQKARARELVLVYERRELEREGRQARELQVRDSRYRTLFDSVDQGICVCELQPGGVAVIDFNPGFARMMGMGAADDAGAVLDGLPGLERSRLERYAAIATEGRCDRFETVSARTGRSFEVRATPLEAPDRVVLLFADITARLADAQRQRLAAERDRYALELAQQLQPLTSPQAVLDASCERLARHLGADRVTWAESQDGVWRVAGGWAPDTGAMAPGEAGLAPPTDAPWVCADVAAAAQLSEATRAALALGGTAACIALPFTAHDGVPGAWWVQAAGTRHFLAHEVELVALTAGLTDTAVQRARSDAAVRRSEQRFRVLGEAIPDLLWLGGADGLPTYRNPAWRCYTGALPDPVTDPSADPAGGWGVTHPDDLPALRAQWLAARAQPQVVELQLRLRRRDGEYRWFLSRTVPVAREAGAAVHWIGVLTDVHERVLVENELKQAGRRKDEFLATLAHELRNPLAPIRTAAAVLSAPQTPAAVVERAAGIIERQLAHMTRLIDDLLDVSRITRGLVVLERGPVDLARVVTSAVEAARPQLDRLGQTLALALPAEPVVLQADATRLTQVIANLLDNASKYGHRGGLIRLTATREAGEAVLRVQDDGVGIAAEHLERVFGLFEQVDRSAASSRGGLGIGLTLVRQLAVLHGGSVTAHSDGPGQGSTFTVRLPLPAVPAAAGLTAAPEPWAATAGPARRVLVADDNRDAAETLVMMLSMAGHQVAAAHDGRQALALGEQLLPEVVLLDLGMPELDGYATADALRTTPWGRRALLVAVTGWGQPEDIARTRAHGFDHHLVKPVDVAALLALIEATGAGSAA